MNSSGEKVFAFAIETLYIFCLRGRGLLINKTVVKIWELVEFVGNSGTKLQSCLRNENSYSFPFTILLRILASLNTL